jgi:hypothetical protein
MNDYMQVSYGARYAADVQRMQTLAAQPLNLKGEDKARTVSLHPDRSSTPGIAAHLALAMLAQSVDRESQTNFVLRLAGVDAQLFGRPCGSVGTQQSR